MQKNSQILTPDQSNSPIKIWWMAARPKTLSLSIVPIIVGTVLASEQVQMNWILAALALISAIFIHIGINIINDALDFKRGADTEERLGPQRVTQSGLLSYKQVLNGGFFCFFAALISGIPLMFAAGWPLIFALVLSVLFGYFYTGGPMPLAYFGLGELFVMLFFGYVITCSTYYIQTGFIDSTCFLAATQIGLLAVVPIVINNTRDIITDLKANKQTLSARFGITFSRLEVILLTVAAYLIGLSWIIKEQPMMFLLPLLAIPFIYKNIQAVCKTDPSIAYNQYLARSAQGQLLFALLLCIGFFLK